MMLQIANEKKHVAVDTASLQDNDDAASIDNELKDKSEKNYIEIAQNIVEVSSEQLWLQNSSKRRLKNIFTTFFIFFISVQYLVLVALLFVKAFVDINLTDAMLIAYITSVFVETLAAIAVMIKYAFDSEQEVQILAILNSVISNYQKFGKEKNKDSDK